MSQKLGGLIDLLLDVCGVAKDALLQAKEDTQQLQSILRRRRGDEAGFIYEAKEYLASSKKAKKLRNKSLKSLDGIKIDQLVFTVQVDELQTHNTRGRSNENQ
ncbi:hypothetical protein GOBAR_DD04560 [Gossypium barbadense]|nr:hypothetical protein GOBAR_DD04560 [Gossypium barbadense]